MGLFDWAGDAWDGVTHVASDAWHGVTDAASWVGDRLGDVGGFLADHWKTIAAVAVGTIAFVAVATFAPELLPGLFALAPSLAPWLVLGGAGAASGAATRVFDDLVDGRTPGWDVLQAAAITGAATVLTAGTLQWLAPKVGEALPALKPLADRFVVAGSAAGDGAGSVEPVIKAPLSAAEEAAPGVVADSGTSTAASTAAAATPPHLSPTQAFWRAPKTRGLIGLLSGDAGNRANHHIDRKNEQERDAPGPARRARED